MIMKKKLITVVLIIIGLFCILMNGCSTTKAAWTNDQVPSFSKGMKSQAVLERFGQPDRKNYSDDVQVWEYRKPAEASSGKNMLAAIGSFGVASGKDSGFVDILRFKVKDNVVIGIESEENVMGINIPGFSK